MTHETHVPSLAERLVKISHGPVGLLPVRRKPEKHALIYLFPLEAVSPLSISVSRQLIYGRCLSGLLAASGFEVNCRGLFGDYDELKINLAMSIWLRYLELCGEQVPYPETCYKGDYVFDFAATVHRNYGDRWRLPVKTAMALSAEAPDQWFAVMKSRLGDEALRLIMQIGLDGIIGDVNKDLRDLGVGFDHWQSAGKLIDSASVAKMMERLAKSHLIQEESGERYLYLSSSPKVLMENDAGPTRLAVQLQHFLTGLEHESELVITIYDITQKRTIELFKQCAQALGYAVDSIVDKPVTPPQFYEDGELVSASPFEEGFVSFREVRETVGLAQLQWDFLIHKAHDPGKYELAQRGEHTACSHLHKCNAIIRDLTHKASPVDKVDKRRLESAIMRLPEIEQQHLELMVQEISMFPGVVDQAACSLEPVPLLTYMQNLCETFLSYYNNHDLENKLTALHQEHKSEVFTVVASALRQVISVFNNLTGMHPLNTIR